MDANMVDMKYTAKEKKDEATEMMGKPQDYPWGLAIRLEQEELDKLGIKDLPSVGDEVHINAVGMITGVNQNKQGGETETCVAIQITYLQVLPEAPHSREEKETAADENREHSGTRSVMTNSMSRK